MLRLWHSYIRTLNKYPTATQMVQTSILCGLGDVACQVLVEGRTRLSGPSQPEQVLDFTRTARFAAVGFVFIAPVIRVWYFALERAVNPLMYPPAKATLAKVALDQIGFAPVFQASVISAIGLSQGKNIPEIGLKLDREWSDIVLANWMFWPWIQLANFFYAPVLVRPLVVGIAAFFWNIYFSWKANRIKELERME